jgi:Holliday junction DNA helicase RuvA
MIVSLTGHIITLKPSFLVIDVHGVGYQVFIARPDQFVLNEQATILTYQVFREDDVYLVGFAQEIDRELFVRLISVKGIGPKTALGALAGALSSQIVAAINAGNLSFLKSLPGIGPKAASQVILDLRGKLVESNTKLPTSPLMLDAKEALVQLGFKTKAIDEVLKTIHPDDLSLEAIIKIALKKLGSL